MCNDTGISTSVRGHQDKLRLQSLRLVLSKALQQNDKLNICTEMVICRLLVNGHAVRDNGERTGRDFRVEAGKDRVDVIKIFCIVKEMSAGVVDGYCSN
jgi:hypothetical protein